MPGAQMQMLDGWWPLVQWNQNVRFPLAFVSAATETHTSVEFDAFLRGADIRPEAPSHPDYQ
jgi:hypothetical protein